MNIFLIIVILFQFANCAQKNVCKKMQDYGPRMDENEDCWFNPDVNATIPEQVASNHGFEFEKHPVKTKDGYLLTLFRLRDPKTKRPKKSQPILLHHGLQADMMCFMSSGNKSLAFTLMGKGHDVWLANVRGSDYSNSHEFLNMSDSKYWNFSMHEIGVNDLPAYLEYILRATGDKVVYIGHSMGGSVLLIYASVLKEHAENHLKGAIGVAPAGALTFERGPLRAVDPFIPTVMGMLQSSPMMFEASDQIKKIFASSCNKYPTIEDCVLLTTLLFGYSGEGISPEDFQMSLRHFPEKTSQNCIMHFIQMHLAGRMQWYDYGPEKNLLLYKDLKPPPYNLDEIKIPLHLMYGKNDNLVTPQDVHNIYNQLKTTKHKSIQAIPIDDRVNYNHVDFLLGRNADIYFQRPLFKIIKLLKR